MLHFCKHLVGIDLLICCINSYTCVNSYTYYKVYKGNAVAHWLDHSLVVRKFPGSNLVRTFPAHPAEIGYPISDSARYCQNASP